MMNTEQQNKILSCMADVLKQNNLSAEVMQQENAPTLLRCVMTGQSGGQKDVVMECCFIPVPIPDEQMGLLQFFATLCQDVPESGDAQLRQACGYCNSFCALGAFGFFEQAGQVYLKHNTLLDGSAEPEKIIAFVAHNISLLLAAVNRFAEGLDAVAYTGMTVDDAVEKGLFPKI